MIKKTKNVSELNNKFLAPVTSPVTTPAYYLLLPGVYSPVFVIFADDNHSSLTKHRRGIKENRHYLQKSWAVSEIGVVLAFVPIHKATPQDQENKPKRINDKYICSQRFSTRRITINEGFY